MKIINRVIRKYFFLIVAMLLVMSFLVGFAPMKPTTVDADPALGAAIKQFLVMGGFAALVAMFINIFKAIGWVKDGTAGTISAIVNMVGLVGVFVLQNFFPNISITAIDEHMTIIAQILTSIFTYVYQYWVSSGTHRVLSAGNVPLIGTSNTPKAQWIEMSLGETKEAE